MHAIIPNVIRTRRVRLLVLICLIVAIGLLFPPGTRTGIAAAETSSQAHSEHKAMRLPCPDHIVIVIEENKGFDDLFSSKCPENSGGPCAPYFISLAAKGASLERFYAFHHPSQPNYLELFSGSNEGVIGDCCPLEKCQPQATCNTKCVPVVSPPVLIGPSLAGLLINKDSSLAPNTKPLTFVGYAEDLPKDKSLCCYSEDGSHYARKHCPWLDYIDVPEKNPDGTPTTLPFDHEFWGHKGDVQRFSALPTVSFVIPNLINDMHSLPEHISHKTFLETSLKREKWHALVGRLVNQGDVWLKRYLVDYVEYAMKPENNSLLIVTWDEDSNGLGCRHPCPTIPPDNHIPTIIVGAKVKSGCQSCEQYTFYNLLRTILDMYHLPLIGGSQRAEPITDIWR
ncbi:MAG: alkaline phosphatase family protein [Desulfomonilaceae bacterium]